jgi:hypothetical protein
MQDVEATICKDKPLPLRIQKDALKTCFFNSQDFRALDFHKTAFDDCFASNIYPAVFREGRCSLSPIRKSQNPLGMTRKAGNHLPCLNTASLINSSKPTAVMTTELTLE